MLRISLPLLVALVLPLSASAQGLTGASADTTGSQTIKIDGLGSDTSFFGIDVSFDDAKRFTALTSDGDTFKGKYKLKKQGRKVIFKLKKSAARKLRRRLEQGIESFGFDDVDIDKLKEKFKGKINEAGTSITIKGKAKFEGEADGDDGEGDWKFTTNGALINPT